MQKKSKFQLRSIIIFISISLLGFILSLSSPILAMGTSAIRLEGENYQQAYNRVRKTGPKRFMMEGLKTPEDLQVILEAIDLQTIPRVSSLKGLEQEFAYVRDSRFLKTEEPDFPRRLTWLYPDDGCYARAELAARKLVDHGYTSPKKIFAFGDLKAETPNSEKGYVEWWYHVAVTYRVDDLIYVLDPALDPNHPMQLKDWHQAIGGEEAHIRYAICSYKTFDTDSDCVRPKQIGRNQAEFEQRNFLYEEWDRLVDLDRNPILELGDSPPWLNHFFQNINKILN